MCGTDSPWSLVSLCRLETGGAVGGRLLSRCAVRCGRGGGNCIQARSQHNRGKLDFHCSFGLFGRFNIEDRKKFLESKIFVK